MKKFPEFIIDTNPSVRKIEKMEDWKEYKKRYGKDEYLKRAKRLDPKSRTFGFWFNVELPETWSGAQTLEDFGKEEGVELF